MISFWWCVSTTWYSYWLPSPFVLIVVQQIRICQPACLCCSERQQSSRQMADMPCLFDGTGPDVFALHGQKSLKLCFGNRCLLEVLHWRRENGSPDCWKTGLKLDPFMDLPDEFLLYLQFLGPTFECVYSWPLEQQFDNDWAKDDKPDVESFNFVQWRTRTRVFWTLGRS